MGFNFDVANCVREAIIMYDKGDCYDLILLDINLLNGFRCANLSIYEVLSKSTNGKI